MVFCEEKYSGKLDLGIFETDLAQLSILETELKDRPVNKAALSLSFLQHETVSLIIALLSTQNNH